MAKPPAEVFVIVVGDRLISAAYPTLEDAQPGAISVGGTVARYRLACTKRGPTLYVVQDGDGRFISVPVERAEADRVAREWNVRPPSGAPPYTVHECRIVRPKREPIAWAIKDKDGRFLFDTSVRADGTNMTVRVDWCPSTDLTFALRYRSKEDAEATIGQLDDDLRAVPVPIVRKGAQ